MKNILEIEESHRQFREAWTTLGRCSPGGRVFDLPGLRIVDSGQPWVFTNAAFLTEPVATTDDLKSKASAALDHFRISGNQWFLSASEEWLGPDADSVLNSLGLVRALDLTGMVADSLQPVIRPLPDVLVRRINDKKTRIEFAELNAVAYDAPLEWGHMAIGHERLWQEPLFGFVAYIDGRPVAGAFATPIEDALYVSWVATAREYRRRGLAELVMRRSLAEAGLATGLKRTILHSTESGRPLYLRMGYRPVATFPIWESSPLVSPHRSSKALRI
jgi:GNAT superfamily N-acetyltransferase